MFQGLRDFIKGKRKDHTGHIRGHFATPKNAEDIIRIYSEVPISAYPHAIKLIDTYAAGHDTAHALDDAERACTEWHAVASVDNGSFNEIDCAAQTAWTKAMLEDYAVRADAAVKHLSDLRDRLDAHEDNKLHLAHDDVSIRVVLGNVRLVIFDEAIDGLRILSKWAHDAARVHKHSDRSTKN